MIIPNRIVSVIGSGTSDSELDRIAEEVGRLLGREAVAVVCGGLAGAMNNSSLPQPKTPWGKTRFTILGQKYLNYDFA